MSKNKIVSLIPVREGSSRVLDKNFKEFAGEKSLLHLKIKQLKKENCFDEIYISSNSEKVKEIAKQENVSYLERNPIMCTSKPRWSEVIKSIMEDIPGDPIVAWTLVTSPCFFRYKEAVNKYFEVLSEGYDSLYSVHRIQEYMVDANARPINGYAYGYWHPYTNELAPTYIVNDALYIAPKSLQHKLEYWVGMKPFLFETSKIEGIDINFMEDFEIAEVAYKYIKGK